MKKQCIHINVTNQTLQLLEHGAPVKEYSVSTARNGTGEQFGSEKTPRGWHRVRALIGGGCAANTVFIARRPSGEIYSAELAAQHPDRDWILTRIIWLSGMEPGKNRLGAVDTMRRYIYIHGCPDTEPMGIAKSHGCIRMNNHDVTELFEQITLGFDVFIKT